MFGLLTHDALAQSVASRESAISDMNHPPTPSGPLITKPSLLWHLRWTVPLHVALPIGLWWLLHHNFLSAVTTFVVIHVGFLLFLVTTVRWWWPRINELLLLLFINHVVTFVVLYVSLYAAPWRHDALSSQPEDQVRQTDQPVGHDGLVAGGHVAD
jgi:hypothetical protein